jgi:aminoglycoside/choline kinase family phosphotransferase
VKTDELLLRQTRMRFPRLDFDRVEITPIEKGGSDRRFYRVRCSPDQSLILVKYNLEREENRHYVRIAEFLGANGIRAPKIYFHDAAEGLIWIEDLGEEDLFSHRDESWLVRRALYESALDEVARLHRLPAETCNQIADSLPAEFDAALYRWEQQYFFENCLGSYFKVPGEKVEKIAGSDAFGQIAERLAALPRVLVHRDFQSQNIIVRNGQAYLIDFQGMRPGLAEYDLASLLYDPYVELSETERDELLRHYCGGEITSAFRDILQLCALQRLMQALGAYAFLGLNKGHKHFLQHIPHALHSLGGVVRKIDNLQPLSDVLSGLPSL